MKLLKGMYLRHSGLESDYPIIQKIIKLETPGRCGGKYKVFTDKSNGWYIDSDYIELNNSLYSFDINELLKEGDIIVCDEFPIGDNKCYDLLLKVNQFNMYKLKKYNVKIKKIITKEQFENNCYEVVNNEFT